MFKRGVVCTLLVVSVVMANPSDTWASHQEQGQNTRPWGSVLLQALGGIGADRETLQYLLPRLAAKYRPSEAWGGVQDPRFYILSEYGNLQNPKLLQNIQDENQDSTDLFSSDKRNAPGRTGPSLSIVQPLDVLRQRMLLEIARRRAMEQVKQAAANREILTKVGKRSIRQQNTQQ